MAHVVFRQRTQLCGPASAVQHLRSSICPACRRSWFSSPALLYQCATDVQLDCSSENPGAPPHQPEIPGLPWAFIPCSLWLLGSLPWGSHQPFYGQQSWAKPSVVEGLEAWNPLSVLISLHLHRSFSQALPVLTRWTDRPPGDKALE